MRPASRLRGLLLAIAVASALAPPAAAGDGKADGSAGDPPTEAVIQRAARGLLPVLGGRVPHGLGGEALVVLALLRSGVAPTEPRLATAIEDVRSAARTEADAASLATYDLSVALLAIEALGHERAPAPAGGAPIYTPRARRPEDVAAMRRLADLLARHEDAGAWGYGDGPPLAARGKVDESNTQFAVFALDTAARAGLAIAPGTWARIERFHRRAFRRSGKAIRLAVELEPSAPTATAAAPTAGNVETTLRARGFRTEAALRPGAWAYEPLAEPGRDGAGSPSMTLAGLSSLALAAQRGETPLEDDAEIAAGLAAAQADLADEFAAWGREGGAPRDFGYYLFSLEKAMDVIGVRRLGGVDWYAAGARLLAGAQRDDGRFGGPIDTALALLFLNRATLSGQARW
jgi:hypothetical protein